MKLKIDTHIHSYNSSDSKMNLNDIVKKSQEKGINVIAICDHNKVFKSDKKYNDFYIIPGCEFSTEYGHIIGLFLKKDINETSFEGIVNAIHAQDGIVVLAHPFQNLKYKNKLSSIVLYLDGVEVWNSRASRKNKNANKNALEFAKKHNLKFFAGSDAHIISEIGNTYFEIDGDINQIKKLLLTEPIKIYGKNSLSINTAKSQFIKLRKLNKKSYIKFLMFYIKCLLEDILKIKENKYVIISENRKKSSKKMY